MLAINFGGIAVVIIINILVSSMLHLTVMYHGELTTQERCKALMLSNILDSQEEGLVILDPSRNEIMYCNTAAQRHLTSKSPLPSGVQNANKVPDWSKMKFEKIEEGSD